MSRIFTAESAAECPPGQLRDWLYNALDCTGTREVFDTLHPRLDEQTARTYTFARAQQSPAFAMMRRGVRVDELKVNEAVKELRKDLRTKEKEINALPDVAEKWDATELDTGACKKAEGKSKKHKWPRGVEDSPEKKCERCGAPRVRPSAFNPGSPPQTNRLFYVLLGIPPQRNKKKEISTDEDTLVRIKEKWKKLAPLVDLILDYRGYQKQIGFLTARRTPDGRYPSSFNVGAAWTGRFSSSKNPYQQGGNLQNVAERHRSIFIADAGYDLFYADLKQAESLCVAYMAGDEAYIEAHKSGDTHTFVARLVWPELPWTGDIKKDRAYAESHYPEWDNVPGHDFRFQSKSVQHGSNLGLTPFGIALQKHIPVSAATEAQARYFDAFPFIKQWQEATRAEVREQRPLVNPLGRRCTLFGRPWDKHTANQGLAFRPQSAIADILNLALWQVWKECDPELIHLLAQVHDAILGQYKVADRDKALERLSALMTIPVPIGSRVMVIPVEVAVGRNWGKRNHNPAKGPLNGNGLETI